MKVLLLAGYRADSNAAEDGPGLVTLGDGTLVIDRRIDQLRALGLGVICVLAGESADALIRRSRRLADVELVYDTHGAEVSLVSNLRAGFAALLKHEPCFVLPVEIPCPDRATWALLQHAAYAAEPHVSLAQVRRDGDPDDYGFPLLVTRAGVGTIARLSDLVSLADTRLEYLRPTI